LLELVRDLTLSSLELSEEFLVILGVGEDDDTVVVLGGRTKKGNSSNVDFLDGFRDRRRGDASDSFVERVKVANNDGDGSDLLGDEVGLIRRNIPGKDTYSEETRMSISGKSQKLKLRNLRKLTSVNSRVKGLYSSTEHLRSTSDVGNISTTVKYGQLVLSLP